MNSVINTLAQLSTQYFIFQGTQQQQPYNNIHILFRKEQWQWQLHKKKSSASPSVSGLQYCSLSLTGFGFRVEL